MRKFSKKIVVNTKNLVLYKPSSIDELKRMIEVGTIIVFKVGYKKTKYDTGKVDKIYDNGVSAYNGVKYHIPSWSDIQNIYITKSEIIENETGNDRYEYYKSYIDNVETFISNLDKEKYNFKFNLITTNNNLCTAKIIYKSDHVMLNLDYDSTNTLAIFIKSSFNKKVSKVKFNETDVDITHVKRKLVELYKRYNKNCRVNFK